MRLDKWLWAARFFKTRALASHACDLGRIESNGQPAKPAREVRVGDQLKNQDDRGDFGRGAFSPNCADHPAPSPRPLSRKGAGRELRLKAEEERKAVPHFEKPSQSDRRQINRFRDR